jgi:hypothetical protein
VTEPDPIVTLTAQLEELRGQLARYTGETGHLRARLEEDSGQVAMLRLEVKRLAEALDKAVEKRQLAPPPAPWWLVGETEGRTMFAELAEWVEAFLRRQYPGPTRRLPSCWAKHPDAIWELSTLRAEWERIYADPDNRDLQGALAWHDRWLPGVLSRLEKSMSECLKNDSHTTPVRPLSP